MRVIYPQSLECAASPQPQPSLHKKKKKKKKKKTTTKHSTNANAPVAAQSASVENAALPSLIKVNGAPRWAELDIEDASQHVGDFLRYMQEHHDEKNPAFTSKLLVALDDKHASQDDAIASLRGFGSVVSFTDLLALLGPAVEFALALANDKNSRTPENIEKFVIALVLALAEATNEFGGQKLVPLDDELIEGITVTVRNIIHAFHKDFSKINYGAQVSFLAHAAAIFGPKLCCGAAAH